jgi:hypothetical protein
VKKKEEEEAETSILSSLSFLLARTTMGLLLSLGEARRGDGDAG